MMVWRDLSNEAKAIIEWTESPLSNQKLLITVERNKNWFMRCPAYSGDININITNKLFNEITEYVNQTKDLDFSVIESNTDKIVFKLF